MAVRESVPETRELRGLALARERGEEIRHAGGGRLEVPGCDGGSYIVDLDNSAREESCTCPDFRKVGKSGQACKHIYAATVIRARDRAARLRLDKSERIMFSPAQIRANLERTRA